ncbi:uncharacterized protein PGTG_21593 [Puccinia graminis f. sp. tritici CRL 75-36-700-3]|uniref:Uncharacterized protein n=1 Tax=Puccinia graminis f. sp. tritici (strain CRL 75-36-700-3 / race SCCL) TaxID=418459 RepID=H6QRX8_PUCGT|nr:uncharacterized protein PGTG_21593 [Puccinia graminis f. sp. tritici CRL 75-36-700-3]EHS63462.1 hypothetical protein PGTG_21593 [Puccinia graminis f. sp. tritici CRL 75-36-700-3]
MDLDPVSDQPMQAGLPEHLPQEQPMAYTIADGEDVGFGSDPSEVEEAPSDYSEEFHSWEVFGDEDVPEATQEDAQSSRSTRHDWEPFRSQEDFMACLMTGYLRNMLSRVTYLLLRLILAMKNLILPHWDSVRRTKQRIRTMLNLTTKESLSVWNNKLFTLSLKGILANELLNPLVTSNLEFYPHDPAGSQIDSLYQCFKWREDLSRDLRVQMIYIGNKHYYIFEPVRLTSGEVIVPIYFYKSNGGIYAKCLTPHYEPTKGGKGLKLVIPSDIKFCDQALQTIDIKEFDEMYSELYLEDNVSLADACGGRMYEDLNGVESEIVLPNPWRVKANGKIIRHMPITLYSDDTSGNTSKQWNKHISFYFTLAGLHPRMTNQEYHCHFLGTSNVAGVLELAEPIVEEMNELATNGHFAYDSLLKQDVLIMSVIMAFLADSPMHAEITSTPLPANANSPCRVCQLSVARKVDKSLKSYVMDLMGLSDGIRQAPPPRNWADTKSRLHSAWKDSKTNAKTSYDDKIREHGLKDNINVEFVEKYHQRNKPGQKESIDRIDKLTFDRLFSPFLNLKGFDGTKDTPVEILHVFQLGIIRYLLRDFMKGLTAGDKKLLEARWRAFNSESLNVPPIQSLFMVNHYKSFIGKHMKIVIQAAPFVFFPFMTTQQRELWRSLCLLCTYVYQTKIDDMDLYIADLQHHIDMFMYHVLSMTAQWVNKPKFHMLTHLADAVRRFGPPCLFASEKFESFNGILRNASIHSNRQSPGKDIAITFSNYQGMRLILSGAFLFDHQRMYHFQPSLNVTEVFRTNKGVQNMMGIDLSYEPKYPILIKGETSQAKLDQTPTPHYLMNAYPAARWKLIRKIQTS